MLCVMSEVSISGVHFSCLLSAHSIYHGQLKQIDMCMCMHIILYIYIYIQVCIYLYIYKIIHTCVYIYTYMCIYIYISTYKHISLYIYTFIDEYMNFQVFHVYVIHTMYVLHKKQLRTASPYIYIYIHTYTLCMYTT